MSETRRAWTPERAMELLSHLGAIAMHLRDLVAAERGVVEVLEKALTTGKDAAEEAAETREGGGA